MSFSPVIALLVDSRMAPFRQGCRRAHRRNLELWYFATGILYCQVKAFLNDNSGEPKSVDKGDRALAILARFIESCL